MVEKVEYDQPPDHTSANKESESFLVRGSLLKSIGVGLSVGITLVVCYFLYRVALFADPVLLVAIVPRFFEAWLLVLFIVVVTSLLSLVGGVLLAFGRYSDTTITYTVATAYSEFFRGVPLLFLLFVIYVGIPAFWPPGQFPISNWTLPTAIIASTLLVTAYMGEAIKGGIDAVPSGQMEAARTLGLSRAQAMLYIVLPQAGRNALAALVNEEIHLIKSTSVMTVIALPEIIQQFRNVNSSHFDPWTPLILVAVAYLGLTLPLGVLYRKLERKYNWGESSV